MDVPNYDFYLRATDLQKICKKFKLLYNGTKAKMIERLDELFKKNDKNLEVEQVEDESDISFIDLPLKISGSNGVDDNIQHNDVQEDGECEDEDVEDENDDGEFVINENNKRGRQVFLEEREFETLEEAETFINLEMVWKSERMRPSACGIKTGSKIVIELRDRVEPYKPKKKELDPDIVNELYQKLNNQKKKKFSFADLSEWLVNNSIVPDNEDEPFVIDHLIKLNDKTPDQSRTDSHKTFHAFCLSICTNQKEDFEFAFSSVKKTVKSLFNFDYRPTALIADAAHAITNGLSWLSAMKASVILLGLLVGLMFI
ncbi:unnamed protein product [Brachionus calyciflorus]|uniref:SAP domain-containing protein n=1 Tax=Brachionus calyciflorus TaxID=104777 RepID=A0A813YKU6_9BILA|nr:unnamed protein product [Brachionus calyciflorus]